MKTKVIFGVILFAFVTICTGEDGREAYRIVKEFYDKIMKTRNKYIEPPLLDVVNVSITLDALIELDEVEEKLSTVMSFKMRWQDKSLTWNSTTYPDIPYITFDDDVVWKPIMEIGNPHNSRKSTSQQTKRMVYHFFHGDAFWWTTKSLETRCNIDTKYFPFDRQICEIVIVFPYHNYENKFEDVDSHLMIKENSNWKISKYQIWKEISYGTHELVFRYHFHRKPSAAVINLIMPVFILASLTPLAFLLQKEAGDRIGLSLTTLLAISVYMIIIADSLPKTSDPIPIITILIFIWYVSNACIVVLVLLNTRMCRISDKRTVPLNLRRFVKFTRKCFCQAELQTDADNTSHVNGEDDGDPGKGLISSAEGEADKATTNNNSNKSESEEKHVICWRHVSSALDRWFIIVIYVLKALLLIIISFVFKYGPTENAEIAGDRMIIEWVYNSTVLS